VFLLYEVFSVQLIKNKGINRVLSLFTDDAIIYEPFSNAHGGLQGKDAIKCFLEISIMANEGMRHEIEFVKAQSESNNKKDNQVKALVTFERGEYY
jgi:ketosteroid isomerase-like protein